MVADHQVYDLFVIGGGINGCGIARDAAGRGHSVCLAEMNDLGSGTSSGSTKLVHGGLRYLEHYEFRLVREALREREVLWSIAPHIIKPMRFVLPHHKGMRPAWLLRLGLFLYDHIGGRIKLPPTRVLDLDRDAAGRPLKPGFRKAFEYSDCWVDDARLVVLNARDAAERGATILPRTEVVRAEPRDGLWAVHTECRRTGRKQVHRARVLVNAAGPWIDAVLSGPLAREGKPSVRLVQGSHIVVRRKFDHERSYFFQNADGRIFFAIPYEDDFTLIGTTDRDFDGDPGAIEITDAEIDYLCAGASEYFSQPVRRDDIVWTYSAVRPLYDDGASKAQEATRDYVLKVLRQNGAPLINIFGGKITTYRKLAGAVLGEIGELLGEMDSSWTDGQPLPGGEFEVEGFDEQVAGLLGRFAFLSGDQARRLIRLYGTRAHAVMGDARSFDDLGRHFGGRLYEREISYLVENEWATTADDVLWRRTKEGLRLNDSQRADVAAFLDTTVEMTAA